MIYDVTDIVLIEQAEMLESRKISNQRMKIIFWDLEIQKSCDQRYVSYDYELV